MDDRDTAAAFFERRKGWFKVIAVDRGKGNFDIALVIDGTYHGGYFDKRDMIEHFEEQIREILQNEEG